MKEEAQILILNAGSSSLKLGLFAWETLEQLAEKNVTWYKGAETNITGHEAALHQLLRGLELPKIRAVGTG